MGKTTKNTPTAKAEETAPEAVQAAKPDPAAESTALEQDQAADVMPEQTQTTEPASEPTKTKPAPAAKKTKLPEFLTGYVKAYPGEKVFHVTSDRQVFLDKDYNFAKAHQRGLGKGEIKTYNL